MRRARMTFDGNVRVVRCECGYSGRGRAPSAHVCRAVAVCGPGCQLKRTLELWNIRDDGTCGCKEFAAQMDAWGPAECWRRMEEIVEHLRGAAAKRGFPFLATAARIAVARAIQAAEREATPAPAATGPG